MTIYVPFDFTSLVSLVGVFIPQSTGSALAQCQVFYGAAGEVYNTHTGNVVFNPYTTTAQTILELSYAPAVGSISAGDYMGIQFTNGGSAPTLEYIGIRLRYT
jgi:hypothetical protein